MTKTTKNKQTNKGITPTPETQPQPRTHHHLHQTTTHSVTTTKLTTKSPPNRHTHGQGCEQSSTSLSANRITQSKHPDSITKDRAKAVGEASPKIYKEVPHEAGTGSNLHSRGERSTARRQEHRGRLHSNADRQIVTLS